jgi:spermidine synthase
LELEKRSQKLRLHEKKHKGIMQFLQPIFLSSTKQLIWSFLILATGRRIMSNNNKNDQSTKTSKQPKKKAKLESNYMDADGAVGVGCFPKKIKKVCFFALKFNSLISDQRGGKP